MFPFSSKTGKTKRLKTLLFLVNILLTSPHIIIVVFKLCYYKTIGFSIPLFIMTIMEITNRCTLSARMDNLVKISQEMSQLKCKKNIRSSTLFYFLVSLTTVLHIMFQIFFSVNNQVSLKNNSKRFFELLIHEGTNWMKALEVITGFYRLIFFKMPLYIFTMFYITTCHQLKAAILNFTNTIALNNINIVHSYNYIRAKVEYVDDELSFFVFCSTVHCFSYMHLFLSLSLHPQTLTGTISVLAIIFTFLTIFFSFVAMTVSASLVCEASLQVKKLAKRLVIASENSSFALKKLLLCTEDEINLTVWKILPIKRSFILGTTGSLFTYALLYDSLKMK